MQLNKNPFSINYVLHFDFVFKPSQVLASSSSDVWLPWKWLVKLERMKDLGALKSITTIWHIWREWAHFPSKQTINRSSRISVTKERFHFTNRKSKSVSIWSKNLSHYVRFCIVNAHLLISYEVLADDRQREECAFACMNILCRRNLNDSYEL